jgi:hypothetical protein
MYIISFHIIFNENANILAKRLNIPYVTDFVPKENDLIVVFGAHEQAINLYGLQEQVKFKCILIQSEQYESKIFDNKYYIELLKNNYILDWSKHNVERFKSQMEMKVYSFYYYDFFVLENKFENRQIDFFFCGAHSPEREFNLNQFKLNNPGSTFEFDFSGNHMSFNDLNNKLANVKTVYGNNGWVNCNTYCAGTGGSSWNNELPPEWKGAICVGTNDPSRCTSSNRGEIPGLTCDCQQKDSTPWRQ